MKSAGKARNNGLYRHIRTSKEIIRNLLNDSKNPTIRAFNQILNNAASAPAGNQCAHFGHIEGPEITGT